jgi:hypothetical protein
MKCPQNACKVESSAYRRDGQTYLTRKTAKSGRYNYTLQGESRHKIMD